MSKLRTRQTAIFAVCVASACVALVFYVINRQLALTTEMLRAQAVSIAHNVASLSVPEVAANDRIALARRLETFNDFGTALAILVSDRRDEPLAAVQRNLAGNLSTAAVRNVSMIATAPKPDASASALPHTDTASVRVPIGEIAPIGWVRLEYSLAPIRTARLRVLVEGLLVGLLLTGVATALFVLLNRGDPTAERGRRTGQGADAPTSRTRSASESSAPSDGS